MKVLDHGKRLDRRNDGKDLALPGLVDVQINGFAGFDPNSPEVTADTLVRMARALWPTGVTRFCPTITTQSPARLVASVRAVAQACEQDRRVAHSILGIHLEGPWVSSEEGPRGAHPAEWVRDPSWEEFQRLQEAAAGRIRLVTLAPERPGAIPFIRQLVRSGVRVALGHTAANTEQIQSAIEAGATLSTHLGNGAHAQIRRHPNYIWDQLAADQLTAGIIVDGHHLPPAVVKVFWRAKGAERLFLVSDAVAIAGLPPGRYQALGQAVELTATGRVNLLGTEYLAGSALELRQAVLNFSQFTGVPFRQAWQLASVRPLAILGEPILGETVRGELVSGESVSGESVPGGGPEGTVPDNRRTPPISTEPSAAGPPPGLERTVEAVVPEPSRTVECAGDQVVIDAEQLHQGRVTVLATILSGEEVYRRTGYRSSL